MDKSDKTCRNLDYSELKPCPFCGEKPLMVHSALNEYHSVAPKIGCSNCRYIIQAPYLAIDMDKSVKENCDFEDSQTISYWNTRPAEDALKAELEKCKRVLFGICLEKSARICNYAPESCKVCSIKKALNFGKDTDVPAKESEMKDE